MDVDPVSSADGKTIVFASTRGGKIGVWKMKSDGTDPVRICDGDSGEPSPDGKRIVFRRDDKIWVRDLESGKETQIVKGDFPICNFPVWSPDGKKVAFCCRWEAKANNQLWVVDAEGGEPVKVYDKKPASGPHWSPDGSKLVYETETHICTINTDGTGNKLVTFYGGVQRFGRWSPDGKNIVYCQGVTENGPWELYIVPAAGGTPVKLTEGGSDLNADYY
jgi:Tol biopolymer transport system component